MSLQDRLVAAVQAIGTDMMLVVKQYVADLHAERVAATTPVEPEV